MKDIEAFTKAKEPAVFVEFGPPGYHAAIGFIQTFSDLPAQPAPNGRVTLTGRITNNHTSRPPDYLFFSGQPMKNAWVGLNDLAGGAAGRGLTAIACDPVTGVFSIPDVPAGTDYQLVTWDDTLDNVFAFASAAVPLGASGTYDLGDVPVFSWFSNAVFDFYYDTNGNGVRDPGERGIPGQNVNLRWRDGSIYQARLTNDSGRAVFSEVFPFFNWITSEFDFSRWGSTGLTVRVDAGGAIDPNDPDTMGGELNPQPQNVAVGGNEATSEWNTVTNNNKSRVERLSPIDGSLIATEAFQVFLGQTVHFEYAKHVWGDNTPNGGVMQGMANGGIAGGVWYDVTRESDTPRDNAAELWCPGVPRVQMDLYKEDPRATYDASLVPPGPNPAYHGKVADLNGNGAIDLADVDNWPFGWSSGGTKGPEDVKRSSVGAADVFDPGDTYQDAASGEYLIGGTTSFDDAQPTACVGDVFPIHGQPTDCYDGLRNFNQSRPGSSDGFYGFGGVNGPNAPQLPAGNYIVEAVAPPGYVHTAEESKNVNFGQSYSPSPNLIPPECVGDLHTVDPFLELFPGQVATLPIVSGKDLPYCDRKLVSVYDGQNGAADFFIYTKVPVAANLVGITTDDLTNEFDANAPTFGEKYAPPHMPVSIQDWTGRELFRTYTDEFGAYNALVPSSYSANIPVPSGYAPNMLIACMNHPGPIPDPAHPGQTMIDPYFLRQYSQFCYTWSFMPGKTSYLDTPVVPVAAFSGPQQNSLDCELPDGTPKIYSATGPDPLRKGPWVPAANGLLTLVSDGTAVPVMNPLYDTTNAAAYPRTVNRDYGFGVYVAGASRVTFRDTNASFSSPPGGIVNVTAMCANAGSTSCFEMWTPDMIQLRMPSYPTNGQGTTVQLVVTKSSGVSSVTGVTVTVGGKAPTAVTAPTTTNTHPIQDAIDNAVAGDVILVPPGRYTELIRMWKPIRLQGAGEGSTILDASTSPNDRIQAWQQWVDSFMASHPSYLLPGQPTGAGLPEPTLFATEQGPAVLVVGPSGNFNSNSNPNVYRRVGNIPNARIDGFTLTGGSTAGAIFVNGFAHQLQITNNHVVGNQGFYGGGIRVGHPSLIQTVNGVDQYVNGQNDNVSIAYNQVTTNGGLAGAGGGISLCTGSTSYKVTRNWVCGNYTNGSGGGIGHLGFSSGGRIDHNKVIFNQTFDQSTTPSGGGIYVGGEAPVATATGTGTISPGTGNVTIDANLILGNLAGAGDGGGIRAEFVNGADVLAAAALQVPPALRLAAFRLGGNHLHVYNNIVTNNMAGLAAGGISLQDVVLADIVHNTVYQNDSTATSGSAFPAGNPNQSDPLPAGIVSHAHTAALTVAFSPMSLSPANQQRYSIFSNPAPFANDIIGGSRSFYAQIDTTSTTTPTPLNLTPAPAGFASDLAVLGCPGCTLTLVGSLVGGNPGLVRTDPNGARSPLSPFDFTTDIQMAPAFDEGGNFIDVRFGPLTLNNPAAGLQLFRDGHITSASPANSAGLTLNSLYGNAISVPAELTRDFDEVQNPPSLPAITFQRPTATAPDIGADEH